MTMNLVIAIPAFVLLFLAASVEAFAIDAAGACSRPRTLARVALSSLSSSSSSPSSSSSSSSPPLVDVSSYMSGPTPDGTEDFVMQQTMIRVKDPKKSLDFYCNVLGFKLIHYSEFPEWKFNVYFVAPVSSSDVRSTHASRWDHCMNTPGCIELTWNYGTENEDGRVYSTGNGPDGGGGGTRGGFGHIGITVPNVYSACERFRDLGVEFHKSPNSGGMKGLAFLRDPDGYLIEVLPKGGMIVEAVDCLGVEAEGGGAGYVDNSK